MRVWESQRQRPLCGSLSQVTGTIPTSQPRTGSLCVLTASGTVLRAPHRPSQPMLTKPCRASPAIAPLEGGGNGGTERVGNSPEAAGGVS